MKFKNKILQSTLSLTIGTSFLFNLSLSNSAFSQGVSAPVNNVGGINQNPGSSPMETKRRHNLQLMQVAQPLPLPQNAASNVVVPQAAAASSAVPLVANNTALPDGAPADVDTSSLAGYASVRLSDTDNGQLIPIGLNFEDNIVTHGPTQAIIGDVNVTQLMDQEESVNIFFTIDATNLSGEYFATFSTTTNSSGETVIEELIGSVQAVELDSGESLMSLVNSLDSGSFNTDDLNQLEQTIVNGEMSAPLTGLVIQGVYDVLRTSSNVTEVQREQIVEMFTETLLETVSYEGLELSDEVVNALIQEEVINYIFDQFQSGNIEELEVLDVRDFTEVLLINSLNWSDQDERRSLIIERLTSYLDNENNIISFLQNFPPEAEGTSGVVFKWFMGLALVAKDIIDKRAVEEVLGLHDLARQAYEEYNYLFVPLYEIVDGELNIRRHGDSYIDVKTGELVSTADSLERALIVFESLAPFLGNGGLINLQIIPTFAAASISPITPAREFSNINFRTYISTYTLAHELGHAIDHRIESLFPREEMEVWFDYAVAQGATRDNGGLLHDLFSEEIAENFAHYFTETEHYFEEVFEAYIEGEPWKLAMALLILPAVIREMPNNQPGIGFYEDGVLQRVLPFTIQGDHITSITMPDKSVLYFKYNQEGLLVAVDSSNIGPSYTAATPQL